MILHETSALVSIITFNSTNRKTGDMAQVIIFNKNESPAASVKRGTDSNYCRDCKHRPVNKGSCYVNVAFGPNQIYNAYRRGLYKDYDYDVLAHILKYRKVRFGSYGEPVLIPLGIVQEVTEAALDITGYTHQWKDEDNLPYAEYFMASVDTVKEKIEAADKGWRTYRVAKSYDRYLGDDEIMCPNIETTVQCVDCLLCNGSKKAKNIVIEVHGVAHKIHKFNNGVK
jgi:hypothetical protein